MPSANPSDTTVSDLQANFSSERESELRQLIRERTGIIVQNHQLENLHHTVLTVMQRYGHTQFESFMQSLLPAKHNSPELEFLIDGITVGESYFFRDTGQIDFLRNQYLPALIARRSNTDKHLRIWSAGCSDGQELYTIAFLLCELIPDIQNWRIHLLGTDINTNTLASCLSGFYREWSFRNTSDEIKDRYFHTINNGYELNQDIQAMSRFNYLNLAEDSFPSLLTDTNAMDLILCRNVFIYFDQTTVDKIMKKFVQCLTPDGVLMLGASDMFASDVSGLELVQDKSVFYYQRDDYKAIDKQVDDAKETSCLKSSQSFKLDDSPPPELVADITRSKPLSLSEDLINQLHTYLAEENWQEVDKMVDRCLLSMEQTAELLVYKATAAANLGELDKATLLCQQALEIDSIDKHAHFLSAIVLMESEQMDAAEAALRKVLFLDAKFLEAHYQLGLLLLRCNRQTQGIKSLKNALRLAEQGKPQYNLHGAPNTNFERMAEVLRNEINLHESISHEESLSKAQL